MMLKRHRQCGPLHDLATSGKTVYGVNRLWLFRPYAYFAGGYFQAATEHHRFPCGGRGRIAAPRFGDGHVVDYAQFHLPWPPRCVDGEGRADYHLAQPRHVGRCAGARQCGRIRRFGAHGPCGAGLAGQGGCSGVTASFASIPAAEALKNITLSR